MPPPPPPPRQRDYAAGLPAVLGPPAAVAPLHKSMERVRAPLGLVPVGRGRRRLAPDLPRGLHSAGAGADRGLLQPFAAAPAHHGQSLAGAGGFGRRPARPGMRCQGPARGGRLAGAPSCAESRGIVRGASSCAGRRRRRPLRRMPPPPLPRARSGPGSVGARVALMPPFACLCKCNGRAAIAVPAACPALSSCSPVPRSADLGADFSQPPARAGRRPMPSWEAARGRRGGRIRHCRAATARAGRARTAGREGGRGGDRLVRRPPRGRFATMGRRGAAGSAVRRSGQI